MTLKAEKVSLCRGELGEKVRKCKNHLLRKRGRGESIHTVKGTQGAGSSEQVGTSQVEGAALVEMEMEG